MDNLIAELERATEGSRKLDKAIYVALGLPITNKDRLDPQMIEIHLESVAPRYTTFLDAAEKLVPPGLCWEVEAGPKTGGVACVGTVHGPMEGIAVTPALSLCIAALKARQTMKDAT